MTEKMEDIFNRIHRLQAEGILKLLQAGNLSATEINAINKFLSDNGITGVKGENEALNKLSEGLEAFEQSAGFTH